MKLPSISLFLFAILSSALLVIASPTTRTARIVTERLQLANKQTNDADELVGDTDLFNLVVNGPAVGVQLVEIIYTVLSLSLTLTNTDDSFSTIDSEDIFRLVVTFTTSQSALMNRLSGRFGLLSSFSLSEPVRSSIIVLDTAVQQIAENTVRLAPARREELSEVFESMRGDYKKLLRNYSGYKRVGEL